VASAEPYLDYLLDRAARTRDLSRSDGRREFVHEMLAVAARIPDATARDQFADRLSHVARVSEEVVRMEIRRAAVAKRTTVAGPAAGTGLAGLNRRSATCSPRCCWTRPRRPPRWRGWTTPTWRGWPPARSSGWRRDGERGARVDAGSASRASK